MEIKSYEKFRTVEEWSAWCFSHGAFNVAKKCPRCNNLISVETGYHDLGIALIRHLDECGGYSATQKDLYGNPLLLKAEVKRPMGKIPESRISRGVSNILKPMKLGANGEALAIGTRMKFRVTKEHVESETGLISVPVTYGSGLEGNFPFNKTTTTMFVDLLGDDSLEWVGATYEAVVVPTKNVSTGQPTLGWSVLRETITQAKKK